MFRKIDIDGGERGEQAAGTMREDQRAASMGGLRCEASGPILPKVE